jgi:hypothetical protein
MTGGNGGRLTSPAYRLKSQPAKPASTCACKYAFARRFGNSLGLIVRQQDRLRPSTGKVEPVRVLRVLGRNGYFQAVDELAQATRPVFDGSGSNADAYPSFGKGVCMIV